MDSIAEKSMALPFAFGRCCGNSFIVYDCLVTAIHDGHKPELARSGIRDYGADSALFIEPSDSADLSLRIIEKDGSESDCCGNGALLVAASKGLRRVSIETKGGKLTVLCESVKLALLLDTADFTTQASVFKDFPCVQVNCGEPHLVHVRQAGKEHDLALLGASAQTQYVDGMNVSIIIPEGRAAYRIQTYERGVNGFTQSCGTGALAAHCALSFLGLIESHTRIEVRAQGGKHWVVRHKAKLRLEVLRKDCKAWSVL